MADASESLADLAPEQKVKGTSRKRKLDKQDTEKQVEKLIRDNFKSWSSAKLDGTVLGGLTLRQRLADDKRKNRRGEQSMGATFYKELKLLYAGADAPALQLHVKDSKQCVRLGLVAALKDATAAYPSRD